MNRKNRLLALCVIAFGAMSDLCAFDLSQKFSPKAERAKKNLEDLPRAAVQALADFKVPGVAIGVIADGQIIFAQGFGCRNLQTKEPVTEQTLFSIGSCTKAFTTFALGCLVDERLMDWDASIVDILPEFKLADPYATQNLTLRDLAANRSGMPRHDLVWYNSSLSRKELLHRLRYLSPMCAIRERFCYNNLLFLVAGMAMERAAKASWEEIVQTRILHRLQMNHTCFSVQQMQKFDNFASPYLKKADGIKSMAFRDVSAIGPAGAMISNVSDLCRWVQMQTNEGEWEGEALIRKATLNELYAPQIVAGGYIDTKEAQVGAYGLGWHVQNYRGRYHVSHDGGVDGFTAHIAIMPAEKLGVIVLCNSNLTALPRLLALQAFDLLLELPSQNLLKEGERTAAKSKEGCLEEKEKQAQDRRLGTQPSHQLREYEGIYVHPGYGEIQIKAVGDGFDMRFNRIDYHLQHWHYDVFSVASTSEDLILPVEGMKVSFQTNERGMIERLSVPFEPKISDIVFKRKPQEESVLSSYLSKFVGVYEIYGYTVDIVLRGEALHAIIPGQPVYELILTCSEQNVFNVKSMTGFSIRFKMNPAGHVEEALLMQPYGVAFTAKPKNRK